MKERGLSMSGKGFGGPRADMKAVALRHGQVNYGDAISGAVSGGRWWAGTIPRYGALAP